MAWLKTPVDMSRTKNMELGKLLLMCLVPACERVALLDEILLQQKKELEELLEIQKRTEQSGGKKIFLEYMKLAWHSAPHLRINMTCLIF